MARNAYRYADKDGGSMFRNWMLTMVMEKPRQFTIVSAVPLFSGAALKATREENSGESATTDMPHKSMNRRKGVVGARSIKKGDARQHNAESNRAVNAVLLVPAFCAMYPANTQAGPPTAITENDRSDVF